MDKENAIMIILGIIVIGLVIYTAYLVADDMNQANTVMVNQTNETNATINETNNNETHANITATNLNYQSNDNLYKQALFAGSNHLN